MRTGGSNKNHGAQRKRVAENAPSAGQGDVIEYVAAQSADMAHMARRADLPRLALLLELVQREAAGEVVR